MRHAWIVAGACTLLLMSAPAHAFNEATWQGWEDGLRTLVVTVLLGAAAVGALVVLILWALCSAIGAALRRGERSEEVADSRETQAQLQAKVADLQRRLNDAEGELEQCRNTEGRAPQPEAGPARVDDDLVPLCPTCGKRNRSDRTFCWSCSADLLPPREGNDE